MASSKVLTKEEIGSALKYAKGKSPAQKRKLIGKLYLKKKKAIAKKENALILHQDEITAALDAAKSKYGRSLSKAERQEIIRELHRKKKAFLEREEERKKCHREKQEQMQAQQEQSGSWSWSQSITRRR